MKNVEDLDTFIIVYDPSDDRPYYVKQVNYLDYGRFTDAKGAQEHLEYCKKEYGTFR